MNFLSGALSKAGLLSLKAMIDRAHGLSITQQAKVLGVSRGSAHYLPRPVSPADRAVIRRMDELHRDFPFAGSRMLRDLVNQERIAIGRRHIVSVRTAPQVRAFRAL